MPDLSRILKAKDPLTLAQVARGAQPLVMADLARASLKDTGSNPQANQMFKDLMTGDDYDMEVKWSALREMDDAEDNTTLQARLQLMQNLPESGDENQNKIVQMYSRQLEAKINGEEYDMRGEMREVMQDVMRSEFRNRLGERERSSRGRGGDRGGDRGNQPTVVPAP